MLSGEIFLGLFGAMRLVRGAVSDLGFKGGVIRRGAESGWGAIA